MRGCWTGGHHNASPVIVIVAGSISSGAPYHSRGSSLSVRVSAAIRSRGSGNGRPSTRNSSAIQPAPMPITAPPPLRRSTSAAWRAVLAALR